MYGNFTTDRLQITPWSNSPVDLGELAEILDADMTAFLPESLQFETGKTNVSEWARNFSSGANQVSSVRLGSQLAGLLLMLRPTTKDVNDGSIHLGYIFGKQFWGKGLATELIRGLTQKLIDGKFSGEALGGVVKGNPASARVLEKAGFSRIQNEEDPAVDWYCRSFSCDNAT